MTKQQMDKRRAWEQYFDALEVVDRRTGKKRGSTKRKVGGVVVRLADTAGKAR
jgi:hypothetical protein